MFHGKLKKKASDWVFVCDTFNIPINTSHYQYSKLKEGSIILGVRPEDIQCCNHTEIKDDINSIKSKIDFIEYLGSDINVHLKVGTINFTARFNQTTQAELGKNIPVVLNLNKGHFFNKENNNIL